MKPLKDKKITIYNYCTIEDENGFYVSKYRPIHSGELWAYVRGLSAEEYNNSHMAGTSEEAIFTINWRPDVEALMCVVYKGKWYQIKRVDAFEGYKDDLRLYVASMTAPKAGDVIPY